MVTMILTITSQQICVLIYECVKYVCFQLNNIVYNENIQLNSEHCQFKPKHGRYTIKCFYKHICTYKYVYMKVHAYVHFYLLDLMIQILWHPTSIHAYFVQIDIHMYSIGSWCCRNCVEIMHIFYKTSTLYRTTIGLTAVLKILTTIHDQIVSSNCLNDKLSIHSSCLQASHQAKYILLTIHLST